MYIMKEEKELIGKTIGFIHMAQFAEYIMIVTTDGGVFCVTQNDDDGDKETYIPRRYSIEQYLFENKYFLEELIERKIIAQQDINNYKEQRKKEIEEANKKYFIEQEILEKQNYERLKEKFENQ